MNVCPVSSRCCSRFLFTLCFGIFLLSLQTLRAETAEEIALLKAARAYFSDDATPITPSEEKLLRKIANGLTADFRKGSEEDSLANAARWGSDRIIRAERLAWLLARAGLTSQLVSQGIALAGALIHGKLDLSGKVAFPLVAQSCVFDEPIDLSRATLRYLDLTGSSIHGLRAGNVHIEHDLSLSAVQSDDTVWLLSAVIGGDVNCSKGFFRGTTPGALLFDSAKIGGEVRLDSGVFEGVSGRRATIDGDVEFQFGKFEKNGFAWTPWAVNFGSAKIGHDVYFQAASADAEVSLRSATIGRDLLCERSVFSTEKGTALDISNTEIGGKVSLAEGFSAKGLVDFQNSHVAHDFVLDHIRISDKTAINLQFAKVGTLSNSEDSWPERGNLSLLGFVYDQIDPKARPEAGVQIRWIHRQGDQFLAQPYNQLAAALRRMGLDEEADTALIAKNIDDGRHRKNPWDAVWYQGLGKLIGFGYRPWNALFVSFGVIGIGAVLFGVGFRKEIITPTSDAAYGTVRHSTDQLLESYPKFNFLIYSLETFVPIVKFEVAQYWIPNANRGAAIRLGGFVVKTGGLLRAYLWLHITLGWILTTIWVGGFTGLLKT